MFLSLTLSFSELSFHFLSAAAVTGLDCPANLPHLLEHSERPSLPLPLTDCLFWRHFWTSVHFFHFHFHFCSGVPSIFSAATDHRIHLTSLLAHFALISHFRWSSDVWMPFTFSLFLLSLSLSRHLCFSLISPQMCPPSFASLSSAVAVAELQTADGRQFQTLSSTYARIYSPVFTLNHLPLSDTKYYKPCK